MKKLRKILAAEGLLRQGSQSYNQMVEQFGAGKLKMESKDRQRIESMYQKAMKKSDGEDDAFNREMMALAKQMANTIKAADKAYRRAEAAANENFHDVADVFYDRADELMK